MRDKDGIYVGNHNCVRYSGVSSYKDRTCCGGRVTKVSMSVCMLKGVVDAALMCNAKCHDVKYR